MRLEKPKEVTHEMDVRGAADRPQALNRKLYRIAHRFIALERLTAVVLFVFNGLGIASGLGTPAQLSPLERLEAAKQAYWDGNFEASVEDLQRLFGELSDRSALRDVCFFLALDQIALGNEARGRSYFPLTIRQDPSFVPSRDLYPPDVVNAFLDMRRSMVGELSIDSRPAGASVWVSGAFVGETPYRGAALVGTQYVSVELQGYPAQEIEVTIVGSDLTTLSVSLSEEDPAPEASRTSEHSGGVSARNVGILTAVGAGAGAAIFLSRRGGDGAVSVDLRVNGQKSGSFNCSSGMFVTIVVENGTADPLSVDGFVLNLTTSSAACRNFPAPVVGSVGADIPPSTSNEIRRIDLAGQLCRDPGQAPGCEWAAEAVVTTSAGTFEDSIRFSTAR